MSETNSVTERIFTLSMVEARDSSESRTIGGYAAKFDTSSQNLGGFKERIAPGAFARARSQDWPDNPVARYNHDDNMLLGTVRAGTLRLGVDEIGLTYEVDLPSARSDVHELIQRRDVQQSSFAFVADDEEWSADDTGFPQRTLIQVRLMDVAPVNTPAYRDTSVALRSLGKKFDASEDEVRRLAELGELRRFFKRTDGPAPKADLSAHAALAKALDLK